jgi:hypothetical protein
LPPNPAGRRRFRHAQPYHAGVLRIQVNANHRVASIAGLVNAMKALQGVVRLPKVEAAAQSLAA